VAVLISRHLPNIHYSKPPKSEPPTACCGLTAPSYSRWQSTAQKLFELIKRSC
jgi:hypothetical protein